MASQRRVTLAVWGLMAVAVVLLAIGLAGAVQVFKLSRGDGSAGHGGLGYVSRTALAGLMAQTGDGEGQHAPGSGARAPAQLQ